MNFAKFKFRDRLLVTLLFVCIPLILVGSIFAYYQIKKNLQVGIERQLQDSTDSLLNLIKTSAAISIKSRLHGIAQKNLEIAHLYYQKYLSGQLTKDQAIQSIEEIYLSQTIGAAGYLYCLDSNGNIMVHPNPLVKGTNLFHLDFVKALMEKKEGYLEYSYKNPDEKHARSKVISVVYFKPLDWFVCVSAYREEFTYLTDPDDFKHAILSFKSGESGHAYLLHEDGNVLVHPELEKGQVLDQAETANQVSRGILEKKSGKIHYFWKNPDDPKPREKIVYFKYMPEFEWIVASSSYVDEVYAPLNEFKKMLVTFVFVGLLLLIWAAFIISKFVTNPLEKMMDTLEKGASGDYSIRMEELGSVEFITLSRYFNRFMRQLEDNTAKIEKEIHKNIESQKALVENDLMLRNLFDQSFHYVAILSPFGMLERVNQRALDLGQTAPGDVLFRPFWETAWWQHDSKVSDQLKDSIEKAKNGALVRYETTCLGKLGDIRDIDISIKSVSLPSGDVAFIIAEGRDITEYKKTAHEKKELAVQLERSRKMEAIGTLAGGIAHDFNNILSGILGYSQLAQMNLDHPSRAKSHINQIGQGIQRAAELIQQILTFSRQTEFEKKALKLHILVKEALKLVRSSLPATIEIKEIILTKEMVLADPTQMHQVIMNLCTNAYHAMIKTGGVLSVQLKSVALAQTKDVFDRKIKPDTYIELTVTDTGCGMDEHTFSKAFDPYFTTKEVGKGTGFGLALVNAIVDEHGGYIKVQTAPGKGSSFYVYLPRITAAGEENAPEKAVVIKGGTEHIMVVDDEKDIRTVLHEYLKYLGYTVSVFSDGVQAFSAFESAPDDFDLIITDMTMPKMTGDIFAGKVLALRKDMPIILCTGYSETISDAQMREDQMFKTGIRKYIQKPVDTKKLSAVIRSIFDSKIEPDSQKHD